MFNKNDKPINKIELSNIKAYPNENMLITESFARMLGKYHENKIFEEQMDFQNQKTNYIKQKYENSVKKQYNPKIIDLCERGLLIIDNDEYQLNDLYIVFDINKNDFHIKGNKKTFDDNQNEYNKAVRFIDTTAFINLINNAVVQDNRVIINDKNILIDIVNKWDGYLHNETKETDAIANKKMIRDDIRE